MSVSASLIDESETTNQVKSNGGFGQRGNALLTGGLLEGY